MSRAELEGAIREIPDFPAPGILFFDILPLLKGPKHFSKLRKEFSAFAKFVDVVAGIEARGLKVFCSSNLATGSCYSIFLRLIFPNYLGDANPF